MTLKHITTSVLLITFFITTSVYSQKTELNSTKTWSINPFEQKVFIENQGQLVNAFRDKNMQYSAKSRGVDILFSKEGIIWKHSEIKKSKREEERKYNPKNHKESEKEREEESSAEIKTSYLEMEWIGANTNVTIETENPVSFYYTYRLKNKNILAHAYSKIIYKNLYPGIDVEYILPEEKQGIKYNIIASAGADVSKIKMRYKNAKKLFIDTVGNIVIKSSFGEFIDHAPISYYKNTKEKLISSFNLDGNTVSFNLVSANTSEIIVIDPWVVSPIGYVGYDLAKDINYDNAGNVFVLGAQKPSELAKFNNSGILQWIYTLPVATKVFDCDFAVDEITGFSYIGYWAGVVLKVDPSGSYVAQSTADPNMFEIWKMEYDCNINKVIIGGGSGPNQAGVIDPATLVLTTTLLDDHDIHFMSIDHFNPSNCYMTGQFYNLFGMSTSMASAPFFTTTATGYSYPYTYTQRGCNGFNGSTVSPTRLYTFDGSELKRWNKMTGAYVNNFIVPGGVKDYGGGIDVDECENIYIGAQNVLKVFDSNYNLITSYPMTDTITDLKLGKNNLLYACGKSFVASIAVSPLLSYSVTVTQAASTCGACTGSASATLTKPCAAIVVPTYSWMPGGMTTPTVTGLCPGIYTVEISLGCSIVETRTVSITAPASFTPAVTGNTVICSGASTTLTASGASSYTWTSSVSSVNGSSVTLSPTVTTTYTLTGASALGCTKSITFSIVVNTTPTIALGSISSNTICSGITVTITPIGASSYTLLPGNIAGTSFTVNPTSTTIYTISGTSTNGCTSDLTTIITVGGTPTITLLSISNNTICSGTTVTITPTGASTYTLLPGNITGTSFTVNPISTTVYTISGSFGANCVSTSSNNLTTTVTVASAVTPTITTSSTNLSCGSSVTLTAIGGTTYTWSTGATTSSIVVTPTVTSTYTVLTGTGTCTNSAVQTITVNSSVTPTITASSTIVSCGSSATLTATGATTYTWNTGATTSTIVVTLTVTSTYTVLTGSGTCTNSAVQSITVNPLVTPTITVSSTTVSCGSSATLTVTGSTTYTWSTSATTSSIVVIPSITSTYTVLTGSGTCTNSAGQTITVNPISTPTITASSTTLSCRSSATLTVTGATTYTWNTGATTSTIVVTPTLSSTYTVSTGGGACISHATISVTYIPSTLTLAVSPDVTITSGSQTQLSVTGNGVNYIWSPALGLSCTTCTNPIASPVITTTYCALTSAGSCTAQACMAVHVEVNCNSNKEYSVPNAFSPNGDGYNDEFCLQGWKGCVSGFLIKIYDRWGEKIYESTDENFCWDGTYKGKLLDPAVFVYYIQTTIENTGSIAKKGNITLIK